MPQSTCNSLRRKCLVFGLLIGFLTSALFAAPVPNGAAHGLSPRIPLESAIYQLPSDTLVSRVVVKFHEGTRVRLRDQALAALDRNEREQATMAARGLTEAQLHKDLAAVHRLVAREPLARGIDRLFKQNEALLAERRRSGEEKSGRELADLDLYFEIPLPVGTTQGEITGLVAQLAPLPSVEVAYAEPIPEPAQAQTPNLQGSQGYLNAAPRGIDALYSWTFPGGRGEQMRIVDVELNWFDENHEDLPRPLFYRGVINAALDEHGTSVMGVMLAVDNGFGVTGIANRAQAGYQSTQAAEDIDPQTLSVADAINRAATGAGTLTGMILIEIQARGPVIPTCNRCAGGNNQCGSIPMEFWQANYDAIDTATANGTIVVAAAGNGEVNLDDPAYGNAFNRAVRDSWAILVGASGGATDTQDLTATPACFTNSGTRVDLRAWGDHVATTGRHPRTGGDLADNGPHRQYTANFSGTSSATPIVAGAVADVQGFRIASGWGPAGPLVLRQLLVDTGTLQEAATRTTRPIGPQPNLRTAIDNLRRYEGYLDGAACTAIWGWAWDRNLPNNSIHVDVFVNGTLLTTTPANIYRADLVSAGKGNGYHGFSVNIPYQQGRRVVSTRFSGTTVNLGKSSKPVYCDWSIFTTQTPAGFLAASPGYEVGTRFSSKWSGNITALRFYEAAGETGSHTLKLWTDSGVQLRSVTIPATGVAGWRTATIPAVTISARTPYRVSVNTNTMQSKTNCGPETPNYPIYNDPFTAHGGYWGTAGAFPNTGSCGIYFVDVVFNSTQ